MLSRILSELVGPAIFYYRLLKVHEVLVEGPRPGFKYCTYAHYLATLTVAEMVDPATDGKRRCETVRCDLFYKDYRVKSALGTLDSAFEKVQT